MTTLRDPAPLAASSEGPADWLLPALHGARRSGAWNGWQAYAKRTLDVVAALTLLIVLAPVLVVIALAIRLDSPGPILFRQQRCGKDGRLFTFLKFRGMTANAAQRQAEFEALNEADGPLFKIRNDPRVTRVGRLLRRSSLDELPQLWNVLRGDMSLVGPRPPVPGEVARYHGEQVARLCVRGGMTGLWQTSGRSEVGFADMVRLDLEYIERWSLRLDLLILWRTIRAVATAHGAY